MKSGCFILLFAICLSQCRARRDDWLPSEPREDELRPNGANACSYKETKPVQVNMSYVNFKGVPVRVTYITYVWGFPVKRTRTILKQVTYLVYFMETRFREVNVWKCCGGWMKAPGSRECRIPVCSIGCDNEGQCTKPDTCSCKPGFEGQFCQNDINECRIPSANNCEQECTNTRGSFKCHCKPGYQTHPEDPTKCIDSDECSTKPCRCPPGDSNCNATCVNSPGSYQCFCNKGYALFPDGTCIDIDECIQDVCNQICVNLPGGYRCECTSGYELIAETGQCIDIDECSNDNGGCNQECHNVQGGYACSCDENYYLSEDRKTCKAIDNSIRFVRLCSDKLENFASLTCWPLNIKVISAFYGRKNDTLCNDDLESTQSCSISGITDHLSKKCSGKATCFVDASKAALVGLKDSCPDIKKYVEILYTCDKSSVAM